jgi:hypothetical protein
MDVFWLMKTFSMARVGISASRMRRKALATEVSRPVREKDVSWGWWEWNWTPKFWRC